MSEKKIIENLILGALAALITYEAIKLVNNEQAIIQSKRILSDVQRASGLSRAQARAPRLPRATTQRPEERVENAGAEFHDFRATLILQPEFQSKLLDAVGNEIDRKYGHLIERMRLPAAKNQRLRELLAQRAICPELSPSASVTLDGARERYQSYEDSIAGLLGSDKYKTYQSYVKELPVENLSRDLIAAMATTGNALNIQAQSNLTNTLHGRVSAQNSTSDQMSSVEDIRNLITGNARTVIPADLLSLAGAWLTPQQQSILKEVYDQRKAIEKARELKLSLGLTGG